MPRIASHPTYPSVTEVLKAVGLTRGSEHIPDRYRERGRALHELIAMYLDGLDVSDVAAELQPGLDAFREFETLHDYRSIASELEMVHPWGLVGHLDLAGSTYGHDAVDLWDIKYTDAPDVKGTTYQLAGYGILWDYTYPERKHAKRWVLPLSPTSGRYKPPIDVTDDYALTVVASALVVFNAREKEKA